MSRPPPRGQVYCRPDPAPLEARGPLGVVVSQYSSSASPGSDAKVPPSPRSVSAASAKWCDSGGQQVRTSWASCFGEEGPGWGTCGDGEDGGQEVAARALSRGP